MSVAASSAVARVFNVTELLENILLHVAQIEREAQWGGYLDNPAIRLYLLRRVNHTFKSTINGSTTLTRLMFLAHAPNTGGIYDHKKPHSRDWLPAVLWLAAFLENSTDATEKTEIALRLKQGGHEWTICQNYSSSSWWGLHKNEYFASQKGKVASWRDMKVSMIAQGEPLTVFVKQVRPSRAVMETASFEIKRGETLGDFFDRYVTAFGQVHWGPSTMRPRGGPIGGEVTGRQRHGKSRRSGRCWVRRGSGTEWLDFAPDFDANVHKSLKHSEVLISSLSTFVTTFASTTQKHPHPHPHPHLFNIHVNVHSASPTNSTALIINFITTTIIIMASSAATRVFDVAELLESILLQVALDEATETTSKTPSHLGGPACSFRLFVLKRVSRTFNLNIAHSKKLARHMFLLHPKNDNTANDSLRLQYAPIFWLLKRLRGPIGNNDMGVKFGFEGSDVWPALEQDHTPGSTHLEWYQREQSWRPSRKRLERAGALASWRAMKASVSASAQPMTVVVREFSSKNRPYAEGKFFGSFIIEASGTLGEFFDGYVEALKGLRNGQPITAEDYPGIHARLWSPGPDTAWQGERLSRR